MPKSGKPLHKMIRIARELAGFTQNEFAKRIGVDQSRMSTMENNKSPISGIKMRAIARATGCSFWVRKRGVCLLDKEETKIMEEWIEGEL